MRTVAHRSSRPQSRTRAIACSTWTWRYGIIVRLRVWPSPPTSRRASVCTFQYYIGNSKREMAMGNENKAKTTAVLGAVSALAVSLGVSFSASGEAASDQYKTTQPQSESNHIKIDSQQLKIDDSAQIKGNSQQIKLQSAQHKTSNQLKIDHPQ